MTVICEHGRKCEDCANPGCQSAQRPRKMGRLWFLGMLGGGIVAAAAAPLVNPELVAASWVDASGAINHTTRLVTSTYFRAQSKVIQKVYEGSLGSRADLDRMLALAEDLTP